MHIMRTRFVGAALTNHGLATNKGGLGTGLCGFNSGGYGGHIMTIHMANHLPAIGFKTHGGVVGKPGFHMAINGDAIVIPEGDEFVKPQSAGQGTGFVANAFHEAAITHEGVGEMVHDGVAGFIELFTHHALG